MVGTRSLTLKDIVETRDATACGPGEQALEYDKYVDMLIVIGAHPSGTGELFTCRYHDPATKRCTEYAGRPLLCSGYPYSRPCTHCWLTHIQLNGRELCGTVAI